MRRERYYGCDGGCLLIGNASCQIHIPNGIGDGQYRITVLDTEEPAPSYTEWEWLGVIEGDAIHVYEYDCMDPEDIVRGKGTLLTLRGRYSIYRSLKGNGQMILRGGEDA